MLKNILLLLTVATGIVNGAFCKNLDTLKFYFRFVDVNENYRRIKNPDSADFFRIVIPDSTHYHNSIKEYYRNGKIKLVGTAVGSANALNDSIGAVIFDGTCVRFFPNGHRQSITTYSHGVKQELEYDYYPDGKLYCVYKYKEVFKEPEKQLYWECYDRSGNPICQNGNGDWIIYDRAFKDTYMRGTVVNQEREGDWTGGIVAFGDSIKYVYNYRKGRFISATGYDKDGGSYPFTNEVAKPFFKWGPTDFVDTFNGNLKIPKDVSGHKMNIDTVRISFILEKDGTLTQFSTIGKTDPLLADALHEAFLKTSSGWTPGKYFGIPLRTRITTAVKKNTEFLGHATRIYFRYNEEVIGL